MEVQPSPGPERHPSTTASTEQSGQVEKIWSWFKGNIPVAIGGVIVTVVSAVAYHSWDTITNVSENSFNSFIISAVQKEINKDESKLRVDIKTQVLKELFADQTLPNTIKTILESALKHKIGPLYAERFTLDNTNSQRIADVFWREGHSTTLWVYARQLGEEDCVIVQFPGGHQEFLRKEGLLNPIDIKEYLKPVPGTLPESTGNDGDDGRYTAVFAHVHAVTFKLTSKETRESKTHCTGPPKSNPNKLPDIEYLTWTEPLVDLKELAGKADTDEPGVLK